MEYIRGFVIVSLSALAGMGGAVIVANLHTQSPRLMAFGFAAGIVGVIGGGLALGRSFVHNDRDRAFRERIGEPAERAPAEQKLPRWQR